MWTSRANTTSSCRRGRPRKRRDTRGESRASPRVGDGSARAHRTWWRRTQSSWWIAWSPAAFTEHLQQLNNNPSKRISMNWPSAIKTRLKPSQFLHHSLRLSIVAPRPKIIITGKILQVFLIYQISPEFNSPAPRHRCTRLLVSPEVPRWQILHRSRLDRALRSAEVHYRTRPTCTRITVMLVHHPQSETYRMKACNLVYWKVADKLCRISTSSRSGDFKTHGQRLPRLLGGRPPAPTLCDRINMTSLQDLFNNHMFSPLTVHQQSPKFRSYSLQQTAVVLSLTI